jgi:hypothetical protein
VMRAQPGGGNDKVIVLKIPDGESGLKERA